MNETNNNKAAATVGITTAIALIAAIAANLKPIAEGLQALWLVLVAFTKDAPAGVGSFFLALALGIFSRPFLAKAVPELRCRVSRDFILDSLAIGIGFAVMFGQLRTFSGALAGILAGLLAPHLWRAIEAGWLLAGRALKGPPA